MDHLWREGENSWGGKAGGDKMNTMESTRATGGLRFFVLFKVGGVKIFFFLFALFKCSSMHASQFCLMETLHRFQGYLQSRLLPSTPL